MMYLFLMFIQGEVALTYTTQSLSECLEMKTEMERITNPKTISYECRKVEVKK